MVSINYLEKTTVSAVDLLHHWLTQRISSERLTWLDEKIEQIKSGVNTQVLFSAFSAVPRYTGKEDLQLTKEELKAASEVRIGWVPSHWSVDQAARTLLVLVLPQDNQEKYVRTLERVFTAADVGELIALYQALPLLPYPEKFRTRAAEGVRSNMTAVFNAVALRNAYPAEYLSELAWNQIVLKALFVGSPLYLIQGLEERANPELAKMLVDYAHERWAAKRTVSPELWRLVGRFANNAMLADLEQAIQDPDPVQQAAAAIATAECPLPDAQQLLARYPNLQAQIEAGHLTWNSLTISS
ncbi:EboA family metabolite traffic protein [Mastigocladopsis repens]|uniref:EboA family metabolite traffic protein n=1 Tax=Mastigocladopsis repens TaxID=221287 RepID=UPI0002D3A197|nr:EboA family metabolite traffic protein [Mastigocladopsis repens]